MNARRLTLTTLASLGGLMLCSAPALAVRGHLFGGSFGGEGAGNGQLSGPVGVAVNDATGDVYVVDVGNSRVEYFSSAGAYEGQFNGSGADAAVEKQPAPTGQFSSPTYIAVDNDPVSPSFDDVYVVDSGHHVIDKFSSTGEYIGQLTGLEKIGGIAVDSSGQLWAYEPESIEIAGFHYPEDKIRVFSNGRTNELLSSFGTLLGSASLKPGFGVGSNDDLYLHTSYGVSSLNSSGNYLIERFDGLVAEDHVPVEAVNGVAVDLSSDEVYIDNADGKNSIGRFSSSGSLIETFGSELLTDMSESTGIAVDSKTEDVYVADPATNRIDHFAPQPESKPTIAREAPTGVTGGSASLTAQITPDGPEASYYVQYGTGSCAASPASCTDLPAAPGVDIGGGFDEQEVSVHTQSLRPSTVYHFRVIATNALGTTEGAEVTFTTQSVGGEFVLPDGRAWELVSPGDKHGAGLEPIGFDQDVQAAEEGGAMTYAANDPDEENPAGNSSLELSQLFSTRIAPGIWETHDLATPRPSGPADFNTGKLDEYVLFSSNLSLGAVEPAGTTPLPPLPPGSEKTVYLRAANGEYKALVSSANVPPGTKYAKGENEYWPLSIVGATPDFSHVVINAPEGVALAPTPGHEPKEPGEVSKVYEWAEGQLKPAAELPGNIPTSNLHFAGPRPAISDDGSRIILEGNGHVYMRDMVKEETIQIDAAQGVTEPGPEQSGSHFITVSSKASRVFFKSRERLTSDSTVSAGQREGEDLYVFEVTSGEGEPLRGKLTDLAVDGNAGETAGLQGMGVIGASEEGSYVYFVANGVLGDGAEHGAKSGNCEGAAGRPTETCNLYVEHYDEGAKAWTPPTFIAALSGADSHSFGAGLGELAGLTARVAPNGRYLAFMSEKSLTGYENRDANGGVPDEEVFLYDASTGHLVCASCNPTGSRPAGHIDEPYSLVDQTGIWERRWVAANIPGWTNAGGTPQYQSRYLSNSGRLFFDSQDALVPADVDGKEDVYEYEPPGIGSCQAPGYGQSASVVFSQAAGGCVGLISVGTSSEESVFMDASATGGDVFFLSKSQLLAAGLRRDRRRVRRSRMHGARAVCAADAAHAAAVYDGRCVQAGADAAADDLRGAVERDVLRCGEHHPGIAGEDCDVEVFGGLAEAREGAEGVREEAEEEAGGV